MFPKCSIIVLVFLELAFSLNAGDLYPSYSLTRDPSEVAEWSDNPALSYLTTVRLFDYDHHIFQYRRYPCQYFYTDEIQLFSNNETSNQCLFNMTSGEYEYNFQLHFDSRHVEPYILRNIALQCDYINCSFSLLNITYIFIGWTLKGRENNPDCSFDINQVYNVVHTPYTTSEVISLRCKSLPACNQSKANLEQFLSSHIQLIYGSSFELEVPYCSLERSVSHVIDKNLGETNRLLQQLIDLMQRGFGQSSASEQAKLKDYVEQISIKPTEDTLKTNEK